MYVRCEPARVSSTYSKAFPETSKPLIEFHDALLRHPEIADDRTLSADLNIERATRNGRWLAHVEGNTSLDGG